MTYRPTQGLIPPLSRAGPPTRSCIKPRLGRKTDSSCVNSPGTVSHPGTVGHTISLTFFTAVCPATSPTQLTPYYPLRDHHPLQKATPKPGADLGSLPLLAHSHLRSPPPSRTPPPANRPERIRRRAARRRRPLHLSELPPPLPHTAKNTPPQTCPRYLLLPGC